MNPFVVASLRRNIHTANDAFVDFDGCIHITFPIVQLTTTEIAVCMSCNRLMDVRHVFINLFGKFAGKWKWIWTYLLPFAKNDWIILHWM